MLPSDEPGMEIMRSLLARERLDPKPRWILRYQVALSWNSSLWPIVCQLERAAESRQTIHPR